jgi:hypothetical protein
MATTDITAAVANFREAARHLWNAHYLPTLSPEFPWDVRDSFDRVACELFRSLVLEDFGLAKVGLAPAWAADPEPIPALIVTPRGVTGSPILINRERPRSGYWDHPKQCIRAEDATLLLARFFDFDEVGLRDFRYLEVFISSAENGRRPRWAMGLTGF